MNIQTLLDEVERSFGFVAKPRADAISFHDTACDLCSYLRQDLLPYKDEQLPYEAIRCVHQEMSCLSATGWRWVLPSYLRYCLTEAAQVSEMEIEFLIYNLAPSAKHQPDTLKRLSALNQMQISCVLSFLRWCENHKKWSAYCPAEIQQAIEFISTLKA